MPNHEINHNREELSDAETERLLYDALRLSGDLPPTTEAEVARLEDEPDDPEVRLPESLKDARATFQRAGKPPTRPVILPFPVNGETRENLARAAREGGDIPEEVEGRMRRDREKEEGTREG